MQLYGNDGNFESVEESLVRASFVTLLFQSIFNFTAETLPNTYVCVFARMHIMSIR